MKHEEFVKILNEKEKNGNSFFLCVIPRFEDERINFRTAEKDFLGVMLTYKRVDSPKIVLHDITDSNVEMLLEKCYDVSVNLEPTSHVLKKAVVYNLYNIIDQIHTKYKGIEGTMDVTDSFNKEYCNCMETITAEELREALLKYFNVICCNEEEIHITF